MVDHPMVAFFIWVIATGYMIHLASAGAIDGQIPRASWIRLGAFVALGVALAGAAFWFISQ
jgi:hypothetical protein